MGLPPPKEDPPVPVNVAGTAPYTAGALAAAFLPRLPGPPFTRRGSHVGGQVRRGHRAPGKLDNADYPAYTIGLATDLLGVQPAFLRSLDAAGLLTPLASRGRSAANPVAGQVDQAWGGVSVWAGVSCASARCGPALKWCR